jgi:hypothetical protein
MPARKSTSKEIELKDLTLEEIQKALEEQDGFGEASVFDGLQFETVSDENGDPIELTHEGDTFRGIYIGPKTVQQMNDNNEMEDILMLRFVDEGGQLRYTWANYRLTEVFGVDGYNVDPKTVVKLVYLGKRDIGGGRTLTKMRIQLAKL